MKKVLLTIIMASLVILILAQENEPLEQKIDNITYDWDLKAKDIDNYEGLSKFCVSADYRKEIVTLLKAIHHYDSVLYHRLSKMVRYSDNNEVEKTLKDIERFEEGYSIKEFIHFLHNECDRRKEIEHNADKSKNDIGAESYDGQIYLVETELDKFIKQVTRRIDNIRKHLHHLRIH